MPINPAFVYQNFFGPPSNCHPLNHASPDIDCYGVDGRQLDLDALIAAPAVRALKIRRASSLSGLEKLPKLEALDLDEPESLVGLSALTRLKYLSMSHFTRIHSLQPLGALTALTGLSLSTIASWDASGRVLSVESFVPLSKLIHLAALNLMGVWPEDGSLEPLYRLKQIRYLNVSHVRQFRLRDFARLARALPETKGNCLKPYYFLPQISARCRKCKGPGDMAILTGSRPKTRRMLCESCDAGKLAEHVAAWNQEVDST
jgi:hypothetical protein